MRDGAAVETERVVVGIDDHTASDRAVEWLAVRGLEPRSTVRFVTVDDGTDDRGSLDRRLERAAERIANAHPRVTVTTARLAGARERVLADAAADADLLVIGNRRPGRSRTSPGGRMPERLTTLATRPTVVVPQDWRPSQGDVLLGVDDGTGDAALRFAGTQAAQENRRLCLVRAWRAPVSERVGSLRALEDPVLLETHARGVLSDAERLLHLRFPGLQHRPVLAEGDAADVLGRFVDEVTMVVLGRHHRSAPGGLFSGATAHRLIAVGRTPVCVVPTRAPDPERA